MEHGDIYDKAVLDAIPLMVFIVDEDVRLVDFNRAARIGFSLEREAVLNLRGGDILHCMHSRDSPEGCGRGPFCKDCVIRNSVKESLAGGSVVRKRTKAELYKNWGMKSLEILVTANALRFQDRLLTVLVIEDISELVRLKRIVPICSKCKKVRTDEKYWQEVEEYFNDFVGVDFTHGLCPKCLRETVPGYKGEYDHLNG